MPGTKGEAKMTMWIVADNGSLVNLDLVFSITVESFFGWFNVLAHVSAVPGEHPAHLFRSKSEDACWAVVEEIKERLAITVSVSELGL